jgi:recombination protein RecT
MSSTDTKQPNQLAVFSSFMDKLKPQMALALPKHLTADRMARLALTAFSTSQNLQNCDQKSIAASIMTAGQLGLEPGVNGAGFLIPYGQTCTFVPGWKGLVDLVSRSGRGTVFTGVIFRDQRYTFTDGARRDLVIHNETDLDAPEDITHAYAIGWVKDASMPIIELWSVAKITKHRDKYNKVGKRHYSFRDWEMYCRKVPLLQVLKYMPSSIEVANAIAINHASESGRSASIENGIVIDMDSAPFNGSDIDAETGEVRSQAPTYPADDFAKNFPSWERLIAAGKKNADQVIATARTKGALTEDQEARIRAVRVASPKAPAGDLMATAEQIADIRAKAEAAAVGSSDIFNMFDVDSLEAIPASKVADVLAYIADPSGD